MFRSQNPVLKNQTTGTGVGGTRDALGDLESRVGSRLISGSFSGVIISYDLFIEIACTVTSLAFGGDIKIVLLFLSWSD